MLTPPARRSVTVGPGRAGPGRAGPGRVTGRIVYHIHRDETTSLTLSCNTSITAEKISSDSQLSINHTAQSPHRQHWNSGTLKHVSLWLKI